MFVQNGITHANGLRRFRAIVVYSIQRSRWSTNLLRGLEATPASEI
jgi:hypothetical protein